MDQNLIIILVLILGVLVSLPGVASGRQAGSQVNKIYNKNRLNLTAIFLLQWRFCDNPHIISLVVTVLREHLDFTFMVNNEVAKL